MNLTEVQQLARDLMAEHLPAEESWRFEFDGGKRRAGACHWRRVDGKIVPDKITLSRHIMPLWDEANVRDTILHEIAHALAGHEENHGPRWRAIARSLGIKGDRCYTADLPTPEGPWRCECPAGHVTFRHRALKAGRSLSCGICAPGRYDRAHLLTITRNVPGRPAQVPVARPVTVAASVPPPTPAATPTRVPASEQDSLF